MAGSHRSSHRSPALRPSPAQIPAEVLASDRTRGYLCHSRARGRVAALFLALLFSVSPGGPYQARAAMAQEPERAPASTMNQEIETAYRELLSGLMSPYCRGLTLADCPTSGAAELRRQVHTWLEQGRSPEWIRAELVEQYGEGILGAPRFEGWGIVAWIAPSVALLVGIVAVALFMARRGRIVRSAGASVSGEPHHADPAARDVEERVRAELDGWAR